MGTYKLKKQAEEDLVTIYQWGFVQYGLQKADYYLQKMFDAFEKIAKHPLSYPSVDYIRQGYRRRICGSHSIYYRMIDDTAEIMTILGRQDADKLLQELDESTN
jgi:toxin ParE1/3/4